MIVLILIASFLLRFAAINQSLWLDEAISANVSRFYNFIDIPKLFSPSDFHPPFYYMFLHAWEKIFGNNIVSLRLPSIIFSVVTIYFIYLIGKCIKNKNTGLWAAIILSINPLFFYYSQEVRMYSMVVMFLTIGLYNFIKIIKADKPKLINIIGINIFGFLSFNCFYGSIFLLAAQALYLLSKKKIKLFFTTNIGILLAILVLSPLLWTQFHNSKVALATVTNWSSVLGKANLKNLLLIPLKFSVGRISFLPKSLYYLISGIWAIIVFGLAVKGALKNKFLGFLFIVPIVLGFIFSLFSPLMDYFRFLYLIPILGILIVVALNKTWQRIILVSGFSIFLAVYLFNPAFHREDWKSLSATLNNTQALYIIESVADPIKYYRPDVIIKDIKTREPNEKEIVVVPYAEEIHGFDHQAKLRKLGYNKVSETDFRQVTLEKWVYVSLNH